MTLSTALTTALTGLNASARDAATVSSNLANALTEGYAPRSLNRASSQFGGVNLNGVTRHIDAALLQDLRGASAGLAGAETKQNMLSRLQALVGTPGEANALTTAVDQFESSLIDAANRPDLELRLQTAVQAAGTLVTRLNSASDGVQALRQEADHAIAREVEGLNRAFGQVAELNRDITAAQLQKRDASALMDQRQALIDQMSETLPLRQMPRPNGAVALMSTGGSLLLDGTARTLSFTPSPAIAAHMTQANGLLSGLQINGSPVSTEPTGKIGGGRLAALFDLRDSQLPSAQTQLDAYALDLASRFQSGVDPTLAPGDAGLFTETGTVASAGAGLASRLRLNPLVDPNQGGAAWHLRDGLAAASPGETGDATLLNAMLDRLNAASTASPLSSAAQSHRDHAGSLAALFAAPNVTASNNQSYHDFRHAALQEAALAEGVDSDAELQRLMLVEQAYAANARIIETVDQMLQTLMRIGT